MTSGAVAGDKEIARKLMAHTRSSKNKHIKVVSQHETLEDDMNPFKCA